MKEMNSEKDVSAILRNQKLKKKKKKKKRKEKHMIEERE